MNEHLFQAVAHDTDKQGLTF